MLYLVDAVQGGCCTEHELMMMAWSVRDGWIKFGFGAACGIVNWQDRWGLKMGTI